MNLRKVICMNNFPTSFDCRLRSLDFVQCFPLRGDDVAFPGSCHEHLHHPRDRVPAGFDVSVPRGTQQVRRQCHTSGGGGRPKSDGPFPEVLVIRQHRVGKQGSGVESQVEVAKEGRLGAIVQLIGSKGGNSRLVAPVAQGHQVYRHVEQN